MTPVERPSLHLIQGGLSAAALPSRGSAARSAPRVIAAAQQWAAEVVALGGADRLDLADDRLSTLDRLTLGLLDAVNEYESYAAGLPVVHEQGPAATLW